MLKFLYGTLLFFLHLVAAPAQQLVIKGSAHEDMKRFFQEDTLSEQTHFTLFQDGEKYVYASSNGFIQNLSEDLPGYYKNQQLSGRKFWDLPYLIRINPSASLYYPKMDTTIQPSLPQHEFVDSGYVFFKSADNLLLYTAEFYYMGDIQSQKVQHSIKVIESLPGSSLERIIEQIADSLQEESKIEEVKPTATKTVEISPTEEECLVNSIPVEADSSYIISYWYRGCFACNYMMKDLADYALPPDRIFFKNNIDTQEEQDDYLQRMGLAFPSAALPCFSPQGYPITFLIRNGVLKKTWTGYSEDVMQEILSGLGLEGSSTENTVEGD